MKLLREWAIPEIIIESAGVNKPKQYFIEGVFMEAETPNRNNRIYPKKVLQREVDRYVSEAVTPSTAMACGELNHPESPILNLERISHKVISLRFDGNKVIGRAKVLDTPQGKIAKNLMDEGIALGVSTRGLGSVRESDGYNVVQDDFHLSCIDMVSEPSVREAMVENIMESREWDYIDGKIVEIKLDIKKAKGKHQLEEAKIRAFAKLMESIRIKV